MDVDTKVVIVFDFAITFFPMRPSHYEGTIQSDGLGAYKKVVAQSDGKVRRLACLQHCKRDFVDMNGNPDADEILGLANGLYEAEHKHKIGRDGWTGGGQSEVAAGVCSTDTRETQDGTATDPGADRQVPAQIADARRSELLPERMGRHRGHPHGRRLLLGQ